MEILRIEDLSFTYPNCKKAALENINLSINDGDFTVICGESGCGKSTLLRLIKKELSPFGKLSGRIYYRGVDISSIDKRQCASEIGFVMQNPDSQIVTDKVSSELAFGLESLGYECNIIKRRIAEMVSYFGIGSWYNQKTDSLSGGQKQLLNLASVMAMNPKLILLDEPTAQLDPIASGNFINTLHKINKDLGITVIIVEHRLDNVLPIADNVVLLDKSRLKYFGNQNGLVQYAIVNPNEKIATALPIPTRIFSMLGGEGVAPLTVRECRQFITDNYNNTICEIDEPKYEHKKDEKIKLKSIYFKYDKKSNDVLSDLNLTVYEGEHFCILGSNGSGKSTALNIIAGLLKPYKGTVYINGKKINSLSQKELYNGNLALLPQNPQDLFVEDNVYYDLAEVLKRKGVSDKEIKAQIDEISKKLNIDRLYALHPYDLSGGEMQKMAIAKLLLNEPKILLLDEATKGIDAFAKDEIGKILNTLKRDGITIISVTHDIEFCAKYADRCGMLFNGEIIAVDTVHKFFSQNNFYTTSANSITKDYFKNAILCDDVVRLCNINKGACNNE